MAYACSVRRGMHCHKHVRQKQTFHANKQKANILLQTKNYAFINKLLHYIKPVQEPFLSVKTFT